MGISFKVSGDSITVAMDGRTIHQVPYAEWEALGRFFTDNYHSRRRGTVAQLRRRLRLDRWILDQQGAEYRTGTHEGQLDHIVRARLRRMTPRRSWDCGICGAALLADLPLWCGHDFRDERGVDPLTGREKRLARFCDACVAAARESDDVPLWQVVPVRVR